MANYLDDVPKENAFTLGDKKILNLYSLLLEFRSISDAIYSHYASSSHNYFADWIMHVVNHPELADKLRSTSSRKEAIAVLEKSIEEHKEKDAKKEDSFVVAETKPKKKAEKKVEKKVEEKPKEEPVKEEVKKSEMVETGNELLQDIVKNEREIKDFLWKHFAWDMAKEFMYGMAIGILIGMVLSKIFIRT